MYSSRRKLTAIDRSRQRLQKRIALRRQRCRSLALQAARPVRRTAGILQLLGTIVGTALPFAGLFRGAKRRTSRGWLWIKILMQAWRLGMLLRTRRRAQRV